MTEDRLQALRAEHQVLQEAMADPQLHDDPARARRTARRYAELDQILSTDAALQQARGDLEVARELAQEDPELAVEAERLATRITELTEELEERLSPADPDDARDAILEVKAGAGGEESALFAAELLRMYTSYAAKKGWSVEVLDENATELGGLKDATISVHARSVGRPSDGVWAHLKHEGGVHRVQRVPVTESAGRIHTSAVGVLVIPEADETDEAELLADALAPANLRIDVFRSSGPGGQSVNTTDSAVRITHLPTGTVVSCQNEKSQLQNREQALRILRSRLLDAHRAQQQSDASEARRAQVRTVDRSERIRTYNFPESRVTDHRTGFKAHTLEQILAGDLDPVIESCRAAERAARLNSGA